MVVFLVKCKMYFIKRVRILHSILSICMIGQGPQMSFLESAGATCPV